MVWEDMVIKWSAISITCGDHILHQGLVPLASCDPLTRPVAVEFMKMRGHRASVPLGFARSFRVLSPSPPLCIVSLDVDGSQAHQFLLSQLLAQPSTAVVMI